LVERVAQIVGALTQLVEHARILNGDDGLAGEVFEHIDLGVGEWLNLLPVDHDGTDELALLKHGNAKKRSGPGNFDGDNAQRIAFHVCWLGSEVDDMDGPFGAYDSAKSRIRTWADRPALHHLAINAGNIMQISSIKGTAVVEHQMAEPGLADAHGVRH
jgi:hypothetical protein